MVQNGLRAHILSPTYHHTYNLTYIVQYDQWYSMGHMINLDSHFTSPDFSLVVHNVSSIDRISTNTQYHTVISMFYQSPMHILSLETGLMVIRQILEKLSFQGLANFGLYHF